ncbi:E3 ubiquitin-protein ligase hrd1 [Coemansia spiralis]|uniref:RING-type E3 ubiquitin transferase n=2 Tax=Coemansia TaxID=4863 RepID=A0A9W8G782_9FUNG|nr:hypothetical protein BX070DRAFT_226926 [Coemansia spiralis]KAJ1987093.1 E3 ubiquitin-protein ligase hrd1 [Coemansia umbellata]KAJ2621663.1 E3 ubiquitin-protein ligase hrd1 [Coemansia sp. RSA 1358]KAJ2676811.1 E3 ubiquitin-protein ligase hrd1 [Coemansia spiralis]
MADANLSSVPRLAVYGIITTLLNAGIVASAFMKHEYYYTACIRLSQSGTAMMILANMGLLLTILLGRLLFRIFFGQLRAIEVERLYEQGWFAVTETCLALAILRDEFDAATLALFVFLLFCKVFHWMFEDRVNFMEQQTQLTALFLVRTVSLSSILATVDFLMVLCAVENTKRYGPTMLIVFGFEFALLLVRFMATWAKLLLNAIDILRGGEWEDKQSYMFYIEFVDDLAKLVVYVCFFFVLMRFYGPPIHILRDLYITARSLVIRCGDWIRYRKAMHNMHMRYSTVSQEELNAMNDITCIICREEMTGPSQELADTWNHARQMGRAYNIPGNTPKQLPCSHVFHFNCLRSWLERQQTCPTCRHSVLEEYPTGGAGENVVQAENLPTDNQQPPLEPIVSLDTGAIEGESNTIDASSTNLIAAEIPSSVLYSEFPPNIRDQIAGTRSQRQQPFSEYNTEGSSGDSFASPNQLQTPSEKQQAAKADKQHLQQTNAKDSVDTTIPSADNILIPIFPSSSAFVGNPYIPSVQEFPAPDLATLSDEQISRLESDSRAAVEERVRILSALQVQLSHMIVALTQVQSTFSEKNIASSKNNQCSNAEATASDSSTILSSLSKGKAPDI